MSINIDFVLCSDDHRIHNIVEWVVFVEVDSLLLVLLCLQLQRGSSSAESAAHYLADNLVHQEDSKGSHQDHPAKTQQ